jgi:hypothetical protein
VVDRVVVDGARVGREVLLRRLDRHGNSRGVARVARFSAGRQAKSHAHDDREAARPFHSDKIGEIEGRVFIPAVKVS